MDKLNDYLLYAIFWHTLPSKFVGIKSVDQFWTISPMNLSLVCQHWHSLVSSSPSLWSSIAVSTGYGTLPNGPEKDAFFAISSKFRLFVKNWLRHSSVVPLSFDYVGDMGRLPLANDLLMLFLSERHRWNEVRIQLSLRRNEISPFSVDSIMHLSSIEMGFNVVNCTIATINIASSVAESPCRLRELVVGSGVRLKLPALPNTVSLPSLTRLSFRIGPYLSLDQMLVLFSICPNILTLEIGVHAGKHIPPRQGKVNTFITLRHLEEISVSTEMTDRVACVVILGAIRCPKLLKLQITHPSGSASFIPFQHLRDFLVRSDPPLRILDIFSHWAHYENFPKATESMLVEMFSKLHNLEKLQLFGPYADMLVIKILRVPFLLAPIGAGAKNGGGDQTFCPLLTEMSIIVEDPESDAVKESVVDMIVSRWRMAGSKLQRVTFYDLDLSRDERIGACIGEGLEVLTE